MGRPPLPIGSWGEIYTTQLPHGAWMARAQIRDADGVTRPVKRHGATEPKARTALREALAKRAGEIRGGEISSSTRVDKLSDVWFAELERLAAQGNKAMTTVDQYRGHYRRKIKQAMGQLQLSECTVTTCHRFLAKLSETSAATAVMCRNVLSGMLGYAVIHGALDVNPIRDVGELRRKPKRVARALEAEEVLDWLAKLDADDDAKAADLPDLSRFLLATGARIGEALAVSWREVDLTAGTVTFAWHMITIKGQGLIRAPSTKTLEKGEGTIDLPPWGTAMLRQRKRRRAADLGPVFPHATTGKYRDPSEVNKAIRAARAKADYPWLTSQMLGRKTVATILDDGGATARQIADVLRHANPSMTQDVYMARGRRTQRQAKILNKTLKGVG